MTESPGSDIAQALDTPSASAVDTPPADLLAIVASLDADEPVDTEPVDAEPVYAEPGLSEATALTADPDVTVPISEPTDSDAPPADGVTTPDASSEGAAGGSASALSPAAGLSRTHTPSWPFVAYFAVWISLCGIAGWLLMETPTGDVVYASGLYARMVIVGLGLTAAGPLLVVAVWLAALLRSSGASHDGLFTEALLKGALATLGGVALWWTMLVVVDTVRFGHLR